MLDYLAEKTPTPNPSANVTFARTTIEAPTQGRVASIGVYVTDRGGVISIRSDYLAAVYPAKAVRNLLEDVKNVAVILATNPDVPISDCRATAGRYAGQDRPPRTEMDEFVVRGSTRIPSQQSCHRSREQDIGTHNPRIGQPFVKP